MKSFFVLFAAALFASPVLAGDRCERTSPGKPRAPLEISTDLGTTGPIEPGLERPVTVSVRALSECTQVTTTVEARGGVILTGRPAPIRHGRLGVFTATEHTVRARVPAGAAGELVVIARCEVNGRARDLVQVIPFAAKGPEGEVPVRKAAPLGTVQTDETGRRVHVLRSTP